MSRKRVLGAVALFAVASWLAACEQEDPEKSSKEMVKRMREIEKRIKASMPKTQQIALAQKADPEVVKQAQAQLRVLKEYMDEPSGKIDAVTVNAIQAFEQRVGIEQDGLLDQETLERLGEEASRASRAPG